MIPGLSDLAITARVWGIILGVVTLVAFGGEILLSLLGHDAEPDDEDGE